MWFELFIFGMKIVNVVKVGVIIICDVKLCYYSFKGVKSI